MVFLKGMRLYSLRIIDIFLLLSKKFSLTKTNRTNFQTFAFQERERQDNSSWNNFVRKVELRDERNSQRFYKGDQFQRLDSAIFTRKFRELR